ncbi:MAG: CAP domain-containing protein [Pseudolabrys sp.]
MRTLLRHQALLALISPLVLPITSALALDLNSFRAQHGRPALSYSAGLAGLAYQQANAMAGRGRIDHRDFRARIGASIGSTHAENVSYGCADEDCAIRQWARSGGHRNNMLRGDVSAYGIASAVGDNGRKYWALELGGE